MLIGAAVIFAVVVLLLALGILRRRGAEPEAREPIGGGTWMVATGGLVVPVVVLVALFIVTIGALPTTSAAGKKTSLTVDVVGRQWFWDVDYPGAGVRTANEIHIPVGTSVLVRVQSRDVIHSLWVPQLNRKIDVVPGRTNEVVWRADRAGTFRGQCAEFCGLEHANMSLYVVAEPRKQFDAWLAAEAKPATPPKTQLLERGQQIFLGSACEYCHTIAGTNATGTIGPDLTHLASRLSLAAGTIPNNAGYLACWILDPQHIKPGNRMPATALSGPDFIGGSMLYSEGCERSPLTSVGKMKDPAGKTWGQAWKDTIRHGWDSTGSIVTQGEVQAYADNFLDLDPNFRDRWGNPLLRLTFDWHDNERNVWRFVAKRAREIMVAMKPTKIASFTPELPAYNIEKYQSTHPCGGCTMGTDPSQSVTNSYGQVWDTPNVFVTGAALWPQNPGANPTGTIGAVTYRSAEAIRDRYFKRPGELLD